MLRIYLLLSTNEISRNVQIHQIISIILYKSKIQVLFNHHYLYNLIILCIYCIQVVQQVHQKVYIVIMVVQLLHLIMH